MRRQLFLILLLIPTGCGYVAGNYPIPQDEKPVVPETWEDKSSLWDQPGLGRGFLFGWFDANKSLQSFQNAYDKRREPEMAQRVELMRRLVQQDLDILRIVFFFEPGADVLVHPGDLSVTFEDGSSCRDRGFYYAKQDNVRAYLVICEDAPIRLGSKLRPTGVPLYLSIIVPSEYFDREVASIELLPHEARIAR